MTSSIRSRVNAFHRDESGAFLLLSLAAILILMMMAFMVLDAGSASIKKVRNQDAADAAAYSASSVQARSMNQIVYANLAKRTIVGLTVGYETSWEMLLWLKRVSCFLSPLLSLAAVVVSALEPVAEFTRDLCSEASDLKSDENSNHRTFQRNLKNGYAKDLKALDNLQLYYLKLSPWWAWTETVVRASRNGANLATTYPVPEFESGSLPDVVNTVIHDIGGEMHLDFGNDVMGLPVKPGDAGLMMDAATNKDVIVETIGNGLVHFANIETGWSLAGGVLKFLVGQAIVPNFIYDAIKEKLGFLGDAIEWGRWLLSAIGLLPKSFKDTYPNVVGKYDGKERPFILKTGYDDSSWAKATSTTVLTYMSDKDISGIDRQRMDRMGGQVDHGTFGDIYDVYGQFSLGKSEYFYKCFDSCETPDMWHPKWSARMRPLGFKEEWKSGVSMRSMVHTMLPYLALSGLLGSGAGFLGVYSAQDGLNLLRAAGGIDSASITGVGK